MNYLSGFKIFCEEEAKPEDYFAALGDEFGMDWGVLKKIIGTEPWVSSHFNLGNIRHKLSAWEIVPGSLSPEGADIQLKPQNGARSYLPGNRPNQGPQDTTRYHLGREELQKFLTTGWTPAVQAAQGGGAGMPPMM